MQLARERRRQIPELERQAGETMRRAGNQRGHTVGAKADADDRNLPGRPYDEWGRELPGENRPRLPLDRAILVNQFERIAEMNDDLGPAIGENRLRGGRQIVGPTFQRPDAANGVREYR